MSTTIQDRITTLLTQGGQDGSIAVPDPSLFIPGAFVIVGSGVKQESYLCIGANADGRPILGRLGDQVPVNLLKWAEGTRVEIPTQPLASAVSTRAARNLSTDRIITSGLCAAPTAASVQATGAGGNLAWRVGVTAGLGIAGGLAIEWAAADLVVINAATPVINGQSIWGAICLVNDGSTKALAAVLGTAATTGSQARMTDAAVQTALLVSFPNLIGWARLADCLINRTGDTTVTQSQDNTVRQF